MIEVFPVRKMCLLSFLLLLLTLPLLVHGSASAQTETLRVMVYDRENMPEENMAPARTTPGYAIFKAGCFANWIYPRVAGNG